MKHASLVLFLGLGLFSVQCRSVSNKSEIKSLSDAIGAPQEVLPGVYSVSCKDGSTNYYSEKELGEEDGERVCRSDRKIITLTPTWLAAENANQRGNCFVPANTTLVLAEPLKIPRDYSEDECTTWGATPQLQACRNFSVSFLDSERVKMRKGTSGSSEPCHLNSGKIFGPMANKEDIPQLRNNSEVRNRVRFIYMDNQLRYPRLASYPSYPSYPGE